MWRGRSGLSRPETRLMTRRVSASFAMVDRASCVWFMTVAAPTSRSCTRGAAAVIRARARAASAAAADGARGGGMPSAGTSSRIEGKRWARAGSSFWGMVGGVHEGEEGAVCIRSPEPIAQANRGEREASQPQGVVRKQSSPCHAPGDAEERASSYLCMRSPKIEFSPPGIMRHR